MASVAAPSSVSVIILGTRRRALERCLESLSAALPPRPFEVLVVLNGSRELSLGHLAPWRRRLPLHVLALPAAPLGRARNAALRVARGEVLVFLDDDAVVPPGFFAALELKLAQYPAASVLGGPNITPPGSAPFERLAGALLSSRFGAGRMSRRYRGFAQDEWTDDSSLMLCNLALRRGAVDAGARFDDGLARNEENLLVQRLARRGGRALHSPDLFVWHERRSGPAAFLKQCFSSGLGRGQMTRLAPGTLRPDHLAPLVLLAAAAAAARSAPAAAAVTAYASASAVAAWGAARGERRRFAAAVALWLLFPAAHAAYAAGVLAGAVWPRR
ncbi:glycosyltransferase [bacterium]|nr:MAG: glycosyltransferase [bacterium]